MDNDRETLITTSAHKPKSRSNYRIINTLESATFSWIFIIDQSNHWSSALSWLILSSFARKYGLRRFLFLDKLSDVSVKVRDGYSDQLHRSMKLLCSFIIPCFLADSAYKIWWFSSGGDQIPYIYNKYISHTLACTLLLSSWLYRTSLFYLVCVLFKLTCYLQILRLEDFAKVFEKEADVVSQFASLLVTTETGSLVNISTAGELALCSVTLVSGLFICLRSAAKITHKAQSVTSLAAKWHTCATIDSFDDVGPIDTPVSNLSDRANYHFNAHMDSDMDEGEEDEIDNTKMIPIYRDTISYQKRQALVSYFENNKAGITVFGFMLDRTSLHTIFAIEMSLTLWLLNKTIGFS
ncbi:hypothetical protein M8C21_009277 [Ambrosia artemisiifolia]|uniref:Uncharacterized protein n=1 Tax=Ambrosia artemisiifolia TaxID=4212 RepID=A0AAD5CPH2_AMBAR|nr:hypothetical protein M8C21_009277 [Ambrosia artemisiifolia]